MIAGLGFLALAMCGSLLLVATKLFGPGAGLLAMALGAFAFGALWFVLPLQRKRELDEGKPPSGTHPTGLARHFADRQADRDDSLPTLDRSIY